MNYFEEKESYWRSIYGGIYYDVWTALLVYTVVAGIFKFYLQRRFSVVLDFFFNQILIKLQLKSL